MLKRRLVLSVPALLAIILYLPALHYGYVAVDFSMIVDRAEYHADLLTALKSAFNPFAFRSDYFRPLPLFMLGAEQVLFQGAPFPSHLISLILFAANASLVAALATIVGSQLGTDSRRALFTGGLAGTLYALHPALIESTAWISARFDVLVTHFSLLALLADRRIASIRARTAAVSMLFLAAALSKEMAVGWALALPVWHAMFVPAAQGWTDRVRAYARSGCVAVYAGVTIAGIAYLIIRWRLSGSLLGDGVAGALEGVQRTALVLKTLGQYAALTLAPFLSAGPAHAYQVPIRISDPDVLIGIVTLAGFVSALALVLRGSQRWSLVLPCCFVVTLLPVLNIVPLQTIRDNYVQDRFLTLPLVFAALGAALAVGAAANARSGRRPTVSLAGLGLAAWATVSMLSLRATLPLWDDNLSFWTWIYARQPWSTSARLGLQQTLLNRNQFLAAKRLSEEIRDRHGALRADEQVGYAYALGQLGEVDEGILYMRGALMALRPTPNAKVDMWFTANAQMGVLQMLDGDLRSAERYLRVALDQYDSNEVRYLLALTMLAAGQPEADAAMDRALTSVSAARRAELLAGLPAQLARLRRAVESRQASDGSG